MIGASVTESPRDEVGPGIEEAGRWMVVCAYDGTDYEGWQTQPNGRGIQDVIERRLAEIFKRPVRITGSGRTDSGVHASGQVFHFDALWRSGPDKLIRALQSGLPESLAILKAKAVAGSFDARRSVSGKRYCYRIFQGYASPRDTRFWHSTGPMVLDVARMKSAARILVGTHDFASFAANRGKPYASTVRSLRVLEVKGRGRRITITAEGDGFLYKMVRSLAGVLMDVGRGKLCDEDVRRLLEQKRRDEWIVTAPPRGLSLEKVYYLPGCR